MTPRYVERFACAGAGCADHCCHGWSVAIDERHYRKLKRAMDGSPADRDEFQRAHERTRAEVPVASDYARLRVIGDGSCVFLDEARLCSVQKRFGADVLSDTCSMYPRQVSTVGKRAEVFATLSCPETARLCLLADDALELVETPEASVRAMVRQASGGPALGTYEGHLDDIRGVWQHLLSARRFPFASRLFFCVSFADATAGFMRRGEPVDVSKLAHAIAAMDAPGALEALHAGFAALSVDARVASSIVIHVLRDRLVGRVTSKFHHLIARAFGESVAGGSEDFVGAYLRRRDAWSPAVAARIDGWFANFALNHLLRDWYTGAPDLTSYVSSLLVRTAVLRAVFFNHPQVREAADTADEARQIELLEAAVVETVYGFSRGIEHDFGLLAAIDAGLKERALSQAAQALLLAKF